MFYVSSFEWIDYTLCHVFSVLRSLEHVLSENHRYISHNTKEFGAKFVTLFLCKNAKLKYYEF